MSKHVMCKYCICIPHTYTLIIQAIQRVMCAMWRKKGSTFCAETRAGHGSDSMHIVWSACVWWTYSHNYRTLCLPGCELQISITVVIDKNEQLSIRIRKLSNSTRGAHSTAFLHEYLLSYKTLMQIYVNVLDFQHGFGSNSTPPTLTQICHNI